MGVAVRLTNPALNVIPGDDAVTFVRIRNTGGIVDQVDITVLGETAPWARVEPPQVNLLPGQEETVRLVFTPPRVHSVGAGQRPFGVRAASREDPDGSMVEEGTLTVGEFELVVAEIVPRTSRAPRAGRHQLAVDNLSNHPVTVRLLPSDPDTLLEFRLDANDFVAQPGTATWVKLRARPTTRFLRGPERMLPFEVEVAGGGPEQVVVPGTVRQNAILPAWLFRAVLILAFVSALWLGLLKPRLDQKVQEVAQAEAAKVAAPLTPVVLDLANKDTIEQAEKEQAQDQQQQDDTKKDEPKKQEDPDKKKPKPDAGSGTGGKTPPAPEPKSTPEDFLFRLNSGTAKPAKKPKFYELALPKRPPFGFRFHVATIEVDSPDKLRVRVQRPLTGFGENYFVKKAGLSWAPDLQFSFYYPPRVLVACAQIIPTTADPDRSSCGPATIRLKGALRPHPTDPATSVLPNLPAGEPYFAEFTAGKSSASTDVTMKPVPNRPWSVFAGYTASVSRADLRLSGPQEYVAVRFDGSANGRTVEIPAGRSFRRVTFNPPLQFTRARPVRITVECRAELTECGAIRAQLTGLVTRTPPPETEPATTGTPPATGEEPSSGEPDPEQSGDTPPGGAADSQRSFSESPAWLLPLFPLWAAWAARREEFED